MFKQKHCSLLLTVVITDHTCIWVLNLKSEANVDSEGNGRGNVEGKLVIVQEKQMGLEKMNSVTYPEMRERKLH